MKTAASKLPKAERVSGKNLPEQLFNGGNSRSLSAFPIRMVYMKNTCGEGKVPTARILISVPKRHFKRAVKRNRVKRQVKEAYRKNKHILLDRLYENRTHDVTMAFIWQDNNMLESADIETKIRSLLTRLGERL